MNEPAPRGASLLEGLTVLIVEDETIISFLMEDMAAELGAAEIWHAAGVAEALELLAERRPDAAVLDVNLGGEPAYPVAERLAALKVPFVFATGYGRQGVPPGWESRPVLQKPFPVETLARGMREVLGR
jgi:CheY-like chemotaxis protein